MYDVISNPIPKCDMWATYSLKDLQTMLNKLSGAERALATHFVILTLNACNKSVEDNILSKEVFCG